MKLFGTDGKRGIANLDDIEKGLTPELAFQIGQAAGVWLRESDASNKVVMGRDTRRSGPMLGAALAAGFCSAGIDVTPMGIAPTGAVSYLARTGGFGIGAVISASHNPAPDNGIKLMTSAGTKIPAEVERWIEENVGVGVSDRPTGKDVGFLSPTPRDGFAGYLDWLESMVPERLEGMTVVVDGAHGAAFRLGPEIFRRLGATVISIGDAPDGTNINEEGGATKPHTIQQLTKDTGADLGVAFDGDADRAVFSDRQGRLINGDRMMGIWAAHWKQGGELDPSLVVGTVMSNGGFESYLKTMGVELVRTDVGDKYVSAELTKRGGRIGGEQSGHIVFPEHGPTGDGLVTAIELARVLKREGRTADSFVDDFENWPQVLVNVMVDRKDGWDGHSSIVEALANASSKLEGRGRVNVRASGTQPMLRIMVEADDEGVRDTVCNSLVAVVTDALGGAVSSRVDLTHALGD